MLSWDSIAFSSVSCLTCIPSFSVDKAKIVTTSPGWGASEHSWTCWRGADMHVKHDRNRNILVLLCTGAEICNRRGLRTPAQVLQGTLPGKRVGCVLSFSFKWVDSFSLDPFRANCSPVWAAYQSNSKQSVPETGLQSFTEERSRPKRIFWIRYEILLHEHDNMYSRPLLPFVNRVYCRNLHFVLSKANVFRATWYIQLVHLEFLT